MKHEEELSVCVSTSAPHQSSSGLRMGKKMDGEEYFKATSSCKHVDLMWVSCTCEFHIEDGRFHYFVAGGSVSGTWSHSQLNMRNEDAGNRQRSHHIYLSLSLSASLLWHSLHFLSLSFSLSLSHFHPIILKQEGGHDCHTVRKKKKTKKKVSWSLILTLTCLLICVEWSLPACSWKLSAPSQTDEELLFFQALKFSIPNKQFTPSQSSHPCTQSVCHPCESTWKLRCIIFSLK